LLALAASTIALTCATVLSTACTGASAGEAEGERTAATKKIGDGSRVTRFLENEILQDALAFPRRLQE
jgi:hypothetical protein